MDTLAAFRLLKGMDPITKKVLAYGIKKQDTNLVSTFMNALGLEPKTPQEVTDFIREAGSLLHGESRVEKHEEWKARDNDHKQRKEDMAMIRNIMVDSPQKLALKTLASAVGEGFNAAGDIAANNGNRLAAAVLAASRNNTDTQDAKYGKTLEDKASEAWAQNRIRKGENLGRGLHAVGNVINKALGTYNIQDDTAKSMQAGRMMGGTPGTLYQMIASNNARTRHLGL